MEDDREQESRGDPGDVTLCRGVVISKSYAISPLGLSKLACIVLSLIAFICVSAALQSHCAYYGAFRFQEFVSMTTFMCCIVMFLAFFFKLDVKVPFIAWHFTELIWVSVDFLFFLIASIVISIHTCGFKSLGAGAAFSFFATIALGVNLFLAIVRFRKGVTERRSKHSSDPAASNVDTLHNI